MFKIRIRVDGKLICKNGEIRDLEGLEEHKMDLINRIIALSNYIKNNSDIDKIVIRKLNS